MLKKGWNSERTDRYGGYDGNFRLYEITSPSGNVYKLHNTCNKYPSFYMETTRPGHYDKFVGGSFSEAISRLYELEERGVFMSAGELAGKGEKLYKHMFTTKNGYSVEKIDADETFFETTKLLKAYMMLNGYFVFSTGADNDFKLAKEAIRLAIVDNERRYIAQRIANDQAQLNALDDKLSEMDNPNFEISNEEKER